MYADYFLKFADEAAADAVLDTTGAAVVDDDGTVIVDATATPNYQNIDRIGTIMQDDGDTPYDGYHVNVRVVVDVEDPTPLLPFMVFPEPPRRVWAGPMYPVAPPPPAPPAPVEPPAEEDEP